MLLFQVMKWNMCLVIRARKDNFVHIPLFGRPNFWIRYSNSRGWWNHEECSLLPLTRQSNNLDDNFFSRPVFRRHDGFRAFPREANEEVPGELIVRLKVLRVCGLVEKFEVANVMRL
jgi:hypothetical protein